MNRLPHRNATFLARLLVLTCLGGGRAWAQIAATNAQPPAVISVAEPDAEVNTWLTRGAEAVRAGNPDQALTWLLRVLQADPAALASTNGVTFRPARKLAMDLIRAIPERTRAAYRAQLGLAKGARNRLPAPTDPAALEERYQDAFASDRAETGLRLAGFYLDQGRFRDARQVLLDLLDSGAATRTQRSELLARLVVACARVGDIAEAERAGAELRREGHADRWPGLEDELRNASAAATPAASNAWTMAYGGSAREARPAGSGPDLEATDALILRWTLQPGSSLVRSGLETEGPTNLPAQMCVGRSFAVNRMTEDHQRPSDDVIFAGNRAWINAFDERAAITLDAGRVLWRTPRAATEQLPAQAMQITGSWVFGNRLNRAAARLGSRLYCVEDNYRASLSQYVREKRESVNGKDVISPLPCGNTLAAYDADSGRLLWRIGREPVLDNKPRQAGERWQANAMRFAAPPVACGDGLIVPFEAEGFIGVAGLDANSGARTWHTQIAYRPQSDTPRARPLTLTMDGATAYLCSGNGTISAVDGSDGSVLWTAVYEPFPASSGTNSISAEDQAETVWEESLVQIAGETVVAMPEDSNELMAFDRRIGTLLWKRPKPDGVNYVVGRQGEGLVVAGRRTVASVSLTDGGTVWRVAIEGSTGRGTLCRQEVLIPAGRAVLRLCATNGTALRPVRAQTPQDLPLGNLYAWGDQLLVAALDRLYALADARPEFARLDEALKRAPTAELHAERSRRYAGIGRYREAMADLREVWKRQPGTPDEEAIRSQLLAEFDTAAPHDSRVAEKLYAMATGAGDHAASCWRLAQHREKTGDTNGALAYYAAILGAPDVSVGMTAGTADWEASSRRLAARRLDAMLAGDDIRRRMLLGEPAAQALAKLGPNSAVTALVEVASFFPGTAAAQEAAIQAARQAVDRGDLGTAEAILFRALTLSARPDRAAVLSELARLYERMKWPGGLVRLRDDWKRFGGGAPMPEPVARAITNAVEARQAVSSLPRPPWRLRWRAKIPPYSTSHVVPAGLVYWERKNEYTAFRDKNAKKEPTQIGCLALDTGASRWTRNTWVTERWLQKASWPDGPQMDLQWAEINLLLLNGGSGECVDLWSGAGTTNDALGAIPENGFNFPVAGRQGMAIVTADAVGGGLAGLDLLTGQVAWRRSGLWQLLDGGSMLVLRPGSDAGIAFCNYQRGRDGVRNLTWLDPSTGTIAAKRRLDADDKEWYAAALKMRNPEDEPPARRGTPEWQSEERQLSVKHPVSGAVVWATPRDLPIVKHTVMTDGSVVAQTADNELLLLDGDTGRIVSRSGEIRKEYKYASQLQYGNSVIVNFTTGDTNEFVVLDPAVTNAAFRAVLTNNQPITWLGPRMPGMLLAHTWTNEKGPQKSKAFVRVVNERGENVNGWRLPAEKDAPTPRHGYAHGLLKAGDVILMIREGTGEVLAYEHDPDGGGKK
jgi:outer membrane protein assembly factor BamB/tetratricopeptide (TPR) repeat protein